MSETDKVRHILNGIASFVFNVLCSLKYERLLWAGNLSTPRRTADFSRATRCSVYSATGLLRFACSQTPNHARNVAAPSRPAASLRHFHAVAPQLCHFVKEEWAFIGKKYNEYLCRPMTFSSSATIYRTATKLRVLHLLVLIIILINIFYLRLFSVAPSLSCPGQSFQIATP